MSELGRIAKEIEKKKNLELNLPKYMNTLHTLYHRFAYIHLALNQSARQGCSISVELHKKFGWFIFSTASFLVCNVEFWQGTGPR